MINEQHSCNWPPSYVLRRSKKARRISLRVSDVKGLELVLPEKALQPDIPALLERHKTWIIRQLAKREARLFEYKRIHGSGPFGIRSASENLKSGCKITNGQGAADAPGLGIGINESAGSCTHFNFVPTSAAVQTKKNADTMLANNALALNLVEASGEIPQTCSALGAGAGMGDVPAGSPLCNQEHDRPTHGAGFFLHGGQLWVALDLGKKAGGADMQEIFMLSKRHGQTVWPLPLASEAEMTRKLIMCIKSYARYYLKARLVELASTSHLAWSSVSFAMQKSRWGSYACDGTVRLNYKLVFLPEDISDYVILHELCHSVEHNHSHKFWNLMRRKDPNALQKNAKLHSASIWVPHWFA